MNIQIYAKNFKLTPAIEEYINKKLERMEKYLHHESKVHVDLSVDQHHKHGQVHRAEINVSVGSKLFRAVDQQDNLYIAIDGVHDQLKQQLEREKELLMELRRKSARLKNIAKKALPWEWNK